jgi:Domain of unknown function (DUF4407)
VNNLKRFFWLCSGSHLKFLEKVPTEEAKYVGIGATIFFTGIFASIAAAYALFTFTDNVWLSALFGLLWGAMIFNLDRYIVASMRKSSSRKKEWTMALPRIFLALLISLVIAKPLELKIFEKEINTELTLMNSELADAQRDSINSYYRALINSAQQEINILLKAISLKQNQRDALRAQASAEADGTGGSMKRNAGPIYQIKKAAADKLEEELVALESANMAVIMTKRQYIASLEVEKGQKIGAIPPSDYTGFAARLQALGRLTAKNGSLWLANLFIILLFIAIETAPVMVKLISSKGPYDFLLASEEYGYELTWLTQRAKLNTKTRKFAGRYSQEEQAYIDQYLTSNLN